MKCDFNENKICIGNVPCDACERLGGYEMIKSYEELMQETIMVDVFDMFDNQIVFSEELTVEEVMSWEDENYNVVFCKKEEKVKYNNICELEF